LGTSGMLMVSMIFWLRLEVVNGYAETLRGGLLPSDRQENDESGLSEAGGRRGLDFAKNLTRAVDDFKGDG
jgi:hypothetical protein